MTRRADLVAFVGPSLPAREALRIAPCTVLPPARQGDVWRALRRGPTAIALVDGVFESAPSVWHHEILDAIDTGVAVFGGASMGALRAAELSAHGMVGVGRIFRWYRDGVVHGDDEVALLHAGAEDGHRPLTLPLVNVRWAAELAVEAGVITRREAAALVGAATRIFYQERTWPAALAAAAVRLRPAAATALSAWLTEHAPDAKAEDARATIAAAAEYVRAARTAPRPRAAMPRHARGERGGLRRPSSLVRRRKLAEGVSVFGDDPVPSSEVLATLARAPDAEALRDAGLRHALLAAQARALGLEAGPEERAAAARAFFAARRIPRRDQASFLRQSGLDDADAARLFEDLALVDALLRFGGGAAPDGPSPDEALAVGARLAGRWARTVRALAARGWTARRRAGKIHGR
jgi:hypothetical protein